MQLSDPLSTPQLQGTASVLTKRQTSMRSSQKHFLHMLVYRNYTTFCKLTNRVCLTLVLTSTKSSLTSKRLFHAKKFNTCKLSNALKCLSIPWRTKRMTKLIRVKSTLWVISRWDLKLQSTSLAETHAAGQRSKLQRTINANVLSFCFKDWLEAEPCKIWCSRAKKNVLIWSQSYAPPKNGELNLNYLKKKSFSKTIRRELWMV